MKFLKMFQFLTILDLVRSVGVNNLVNKMLKEVQPSQVTLYSDLKGRTNVIHNCNYQSIVKNLIEQVPTAIIDLNQPIPFMIHNPNIIQYNRNATASIHFII